MFKDKNSLAFSFVSVGQENVQENNSHIEIISVNPYIRNQLIKFMSSRITSKCILRQLDCEIRKRELFKET